MALAVDTTMPSADLGQQARPIRKLVLSTETIRRLGMPDVEERTWNAPVAATHSCSDCRTLYRSCVVHCTCF